ncbi:hypothetical protein HPB52_024917 [Rhipicephalus sanguineus]|uniref:Uncharacterized protein n=1 Tax=Rhipicephalus sanguineus TaxID=34632 RepID=A0A9D4YS18_RHISA|nr:hypothetical protein HPB52_024917 [Rhipicephalus sanguineus]
MSAKPLKAPEDAASVAPVGSLKFFSGGRLVLKLSAQEGGSWVEAQDTPRLGRPRQPPSEDASDDDDGAPGTSSGAGGGATPPLRGSSRCTSWPETAPLTPSGSLATARMATPEDSTSGGCNNTNNSTEDEDAGDDDSNQQRPPSASRAAASPKCPPQAPPLVNVMLPLYTNDSVISARINSVFVGCLEVFVSVGEALKGYLGWNQHAASTQIVEGNVRGWQFVIVSLRGGFVRFEGADKDEGAVGAIATRCRATPEEDRSGGDLWQHVVDPNMGEREVCWEDFITADDDADTAEPCMDEGIVNEVRDRSDSEESDDDDN